MVLLGAVPPKLVALLQVAGSGQTNLGAKVSIQPKCQILLPPSPQAGPPMGCLPLLHSAWPHASPTPVPAKQGHASQARSLCYWTRERVREGQLTSMPQPFSRNVSANALYGTFTTRLV